MLTFIACACTHGKRAIVNDFCFVSLSDDSYLFVRLVDRLNCIVVFCEASGEPPLLLAVSVHCATRAAIKEARKQLNRWRGVDGCDSTFQLEVPATMPVVKELCGLDIVECYLKSLLSTWLNLWFLEISQKLSKESIHLWNFLKNFSMFCFAKREKRKKDNSIMKKQKLYRYSALIFVLRTLL